MMRNTSQKRRSQTELQSAHGHFQGALIETESEDGENDNFSIDDNSSNTNIIYKREEFTQQISPQRGRPPKVRRDSGSLLQSPRSSRQSSLSPSKRATSSKRRKRDEHLIQQQRIQAESFIMKLFDRSLDLSKYTESTELYPICRAWMANQPRNPSIHSNKRRSPSPANRKCNSFEVLAKLKSGEIKEVTALPAPEKADLPRIPPIKLDEQMKTEEETLDLSNASKEELLAVHVNKWKRVKSNWVKHARRYQRRYEVNRLIIMQLFKH